MHKYYFFKDNYVYVMDTDRKLYRYQVTNNLNMILEIENIIKYFKTELSLKDTRFHFSSYSELGFIEKNNLSQTFLNISLMQYIFLNNGGIALSILELIIINLLNHEYKIKKENTINDDNIYGILLEMTLEELNEKLAMLKQISHYQKEEVSYAYLEPNIQKYYLIDIQTLIAPYIEEISFEIDANSIPNRIFNDPILSLNLDEFYTKEKQEEINKNRKKVNIYRRYLSKEINEKINCINLKEKKEILFHIMNNSLAIPCIIEIINSQVNIPNLNKFQIILISLIIIEEIYCSLLKDETEKKLKIAKNTLLTLRKKK